MKCTIDGPMICTAYDNARYVNDQTVSLICTNGLLLRLSNGLLRSETSVGVVEVHVGFYTNDLADVLTKNNNVGM